MRTTLPARARRALPLVLGLTTALAGACGGGGGDPTPQPTPTFTLAATPATVSAAQGGTATTTLAGASGGGFGGTVAFTATSATPGLTATFAPASASGATFQTTATIAVANTVAPGNYSIRLTGTSGTLVRNVDVPVTVTAAPAVTLAVAPTTLSVGRTQSGTAQVTITRVGGFAGAVTLAAEGLPAGVTATFAPAVIPAGSATSTVTIAASAAAAVAGPINLTIRATGPGITAATTALALTVTQGPAISVGLNPITVSVARGNSATTQVTVTRSGGFAGEVALAVTGLPAGVTGTFAPATLAAGATTSTLTLTAGPAAALVSDVNVTVRATGTGVDASTFTLPVTVTPTPALGLTSNVTAVTLGRGANGTQGSATLTIARPTGFTGPVTLAAVAPTGITVTLAPNPVPAGVTAATATFDAAAGAPATSTVRVVASGPGLAPDTVSYTVTSVDPTVTLTPPANAALTLAPAGEATVNVPITVAATNLAGPITVTLVNPPAGIQATALQIPAGQTTGTLAVRVASTVAAGAKTLTVRAAANGGTPSDQETFTLTVTAAPPAASIALTAPATLAVTQGQQATATITLARTSFTGNVALAVTGAPAGVTATLAPTTLSGATLTSTLTVQATGTAAVGTSTLTVRATGTGVTDATAAIQLTVNASTPGGSTVTITFCDDDQTDADDDRPIWVAAQSNGGAWTRLQPISTTANSATYRTTINTRGGIAAVTQTGTGAQATYETNVAFASVAELNQVGQLGCTTPTQRGSRVVNGSVAGVTATSNTNFQSALIALGPESETVSPGIPGIPGSGSTGFPNFRIDSLPNTGALDLVATRNFFTGGTFGTDRMILRRGLNPASGSTLPVLDFGGAEAFAPATAALTLTGLGADTATIGTSFFTGSFVGGGFGFTGSEVVGGTPGSYSGVPTNRLAAGDMQLLFASVDAADPTGNGDAPSYSRSVQLYFRDVTARTLAVGAIPAVPTIGSAGSTPYLRPTFSVPVQADYSQGSLAFDFDQDAFNGGSENSLSVNISQGFRGAATSWTFTMPDFTGIGYQAGWGLTNGSTNWDLTLVNAGFSIFGNNNLPAEGTVIRVADRQGTAFGSGFTASRRAAAQLQARIRSTARRDPAAAALLKLERARDRRPDGLLYRGGRR